MMQRQPLLASDPQGTCPNAWKRSLTFKLITWPSLRLALRFHTGPTRHLSECMEEITHVQINYMALAPTRTEVSHWAPYQASAKHLPVATKYKDIRIANTTSKRPNP